MEIDYSLITGNANILVVDDRLENLSLLTSMLKECGYIVRPVRNGQQALQTALAKKPDLVLLDVAMRGMDGFEVCRRLKQDQSLKDVPVIFISALTQTEEKVNAFEAGGVDYITKPFQLEEVRSRVDSHLRLYLIQQDLQQQVTEQVARLSESQMGMVFGLVKLAEERDTYTGLHLERIRQLCRMVAEELLWKGKYVDVVDPEFCNSIYHASALHDIGKVGIPDSILLKQAKLSAEEFEIMKSHTTIGWNTLQRVRRGYGGNRYVDMGIDIARSHHEKWDGRGYPDGKKGEEIPLCARIMALVDSYDAIRSGRPYKPPCSHEEACSLIGNDGGTHFEPLLAEVFISLQDKFAQIWSLIVEQE